MKKIILLITIFSIIIINNISNTYAEDECSSYSDLTGFSLYQERLKCLCYNTYKKDEKYVIDIEDKFDDIDQRDIKMYRLSTFKDIHSTNMNSIYKCGILFIQKKSYELIIHDLINQNPDLSTKLKPEYEEKINKINLSIGIFGCKEPNEKDSIMKLKILKQTTYETCKYVNYLEYLKERNNEIVNVLDEDKEKYTINEIYVAENKKNNEIDEEINHIYKVFPIAYHAYSEYENNIAIHFLLELLKEDYIILREKLHAVLNPINQVVYKISNAMRSQ